MKIPYLLLVTLLLSQYSCDEVETPDEVKPYCGEEDFIPSKPKDCHKLEIISNGGRYCCFLGNGKGKICQPYTQKEYELIDEIIEEAEKQEPSGDYSIDCKSNYVLISLLSLILLFDFMFKEI